MPWLVPASIVVLALAFDRAMLAAESRGWVRWRRNPPKGSAVGNALLELQSILEPQMEHVVEQRATERADIDQAGDDDPID